MDVTPCTLRRLPKAAWLARFAVKLRGHDPMERFAAVCIAERVWHNLCLLLPEDAALVYVRLVNDGRLTDHPQ
jgi:hypothetical protein